MNIPTALDASLPSSSSRESLLSDAQHPMASHGFFFSCNIIVLCLRTRLAGTSLSMLSQDQSRPLVLGSKDHGTKTKKVDIEEEKSR